ncbi:MAG: hypothetical protein F6K04_13150 [Leptolyngbya sp. SIO4C5]|nr:hypothetical protein [Leptolyngbya sp. SIO4C5]
MNTVVTNRSRIRTAGLIEFCSSLCDRSISSLYLVMDFFEGRSPNPDRQTGSVLI